MVEQCVRFPVVVRAFGKRAMQHGSILGHVRALDVNVLAAGAAQAHDVPGVFHDFVVAAGQEEVAHLRRPLILTVLVDDYATEHDPVAVVGARGVLPVTGKAEAVAFAHGTALRCVGRGDPGVCVVCIDLILGAWMKQSDLPRMHADNTGDPAGRWIVAADRADPLEKVAGLALIATVTGRLQQAHAAGFPEDVRGALGEDAALIAGRVLVAQCVRVCMYILRCVVHT